MQIECGVKRNNNQDQNQVGRKLASGVICIKNTHDHKVRNSCHAAASILFFFFPPPPSNLFI